MSTPVITQFGHTIIPAAGNRFPRRADGGGAKVNLPNCPCRIAFSWDADSEGQLWLSSPDAADRMIGKSAGGGCSQWSLSGQKQETLSSWYSLLPQIRQLWQQVTEGVSRYFLPIWRSNAGGGLSDHAIGSDFGRASAEVLHHTVQRPVRGLDTGSARQYRRVSGDYPPKKGDESRDGHTVKDQRFLGTRGAQRDVVELHDQRGGESGFNADRAYSGGCGHSLKRREPHRCADQKHGHHYRLRRAGDQHPARSLVSGVEA